MEEALVRMGVLEQVLERRDLFDVRSDLLKARELGLEDLVRLVVLLHEQRVLAVGLYARDVGAGMQTDCIIYGNLKCVCQIAPRRQHLVE